MKKTLIKISIVLSFFCFLFPTINRTGTKVIHYRSLSNIGGSWSTDYILSGVQHPHIHRLSRQPMERYTYYMEH